jgi:four helix bundle protein
MTPARAPAKNFEDLLVWQKAHALVLEVYRYTSAFPRSEVYGLSSQFRRAAISVTANIAEGFRRNGKSDKVRMLNIAEASLEECRYYLILANDLGYGSTENLRTQLSEVSRMLQAYGKAILSPVS